jgi:phosphopantothenoylcysteine decarboxylase/phosphopantothenate--cysteine ligase
MLTSKPIANILWKVSGSVATYKSATTISELKKRGFDIKVVGTPDAKQFIGASTWEGLTHHPYLDDLYISGQAHQHILLERWADITVFAPATANSINKLASGIADNLPLNLFLAHNFKKPYLLVPAMNESMFHHPATQESLNKLKSWAIEIMEPETGYLACGEVGRGRMAQPETIQAKILNLLNKSNLKILITGGGTREPIDDVRSLTNSSTGKTAAKLAEDCYLLGAQVTLLRSQFSQESMLPIPQKTFSDFKSLFNLIQEELSQHHFDYIFHAAAVSDFSPTHNNRGKFSSTNEEWNLQLKRNPKIIHQLKSWSLNKKLKIVGFKLTSTRDELEKQKAIDFLFKNNEIDWVVHNDMKEISDSQHYFHLYKSHSENHIGSFQNTKELISNILQEVQL